MNKLAEMKSVIQEYSALALLFKGGTYKDMAATLGAIEARINLEMRSDRVKLKEYRALAARGGVAEKAAAAKIAEIEGKTYKPTKEEAAAYNAAEAEGFAAVSRMREIYEKAKLLESDIKAEMAMLRKETNAEALEALENSARSQHSIVTDGVKFYEQTVKAAVIYEDGTPAY